MKDLQQNIERMRKELAEMEAKLEESKKFEWKYPYLTLFILGEYGIKTKANISDTANADNHGRYRLSKQYAEHSLERNRVANRLEALVEQIEPDYVVPNRGNDNPYIIFIDDEGTYRKNQDYLTRRVGQVYMSKETAIKICELLNSKQVVL